MEKKRALVIDDEQVVLDSVRKILAGEGYEVDVALSGREGIDRATKENYDILSHLQNWFIMNIKLRFPSPRRKRSFMFIKPGPRRY